MIEGMGGAENARTAGGAAGILCTDMRFGLGEVAAPLGCPGLDTLHYAFDFALPVIDLGQDSFCRFVPTGPARWFWLALHSLYGVIGAALSAVVILTLTGVLRRD